MNTFTALIVPIILLSVGAYGIVKKVDIYDALVTGAKDGLGVAIKIAPSVVSLFVAIHMLRASGSLDFICNLLSPVAKVLSLPSEVLPLMLLRPLSGSAALALGSEIIMTNGVDSFVGRVAAVMLGASETTFYTIAVYFGPLKIKNTRYAVIAALLADLAGFSAASFAVRLFF